MQTRLGSFTESCVNVAIGYIIAILSQNKVPQKKSNIKNMVIEWSLKPHILPTITLKYAKEYNG